MIPWPAIPENASDDIKKVILQGQADEIREAQTRAITDAHRVEDRSNAVADRLQDHSWNVDDRAEDEAIALRKLAFETEADRAKVIHDARVEIAKSSLTRAHDAVEFIRNAAAGILLIYQAGIGLRFAADKTQLPISGVVPTLFLGLAVALASAYLALLSPSGAIDGPVPSASFKVYQERRLNAFVKWVSKLVLSRVWALHAAVFALTLGAISIPLPFLNLDDRLGIAYGVLGVIAVFLAPRFTAA